MQPSPLRCLLVLFGVSNSYVLMLVLGVVARRSDLLVVKRFSLARFYLLMGWLIVAVLPPLARRVPPAGLGLLVAGGLCYSLGVGFFLWRRPYAHAAWHGCVLAGGALHYAAVLRYATPP